MNDDIDAAEKSPISNQQSSIPFYPSHYLSVYTGPLLYFSFQLNVSKDLQPLTHHLPSSSARPNNLQSVHHHPRHQDHAAVRRLPNRAHLRVHGLREGVRVHQPAAQPQQAGHTDRRGAAARVGSCHVHCGEDWEKGMCIVQ